MDRFYSYCPVIDRPTTRYIKARAAPNERTGFGRLQLVNPEISKYRDRRFEGGQEDFERALRESTTVYVGNLSFFTTEEQIYEASAGQSPSPALRTPCASHPSRCSTCPIGTGGDCCHRYLIHVEDTRQS